MGRWIVLETASDGQIAGAFGPYANAANARRACDRLRKAIDADDLGTDTDAVIVPLVGHRELLRQLAECEVS